jgi:hypothetical protein
MISMTTALRRVRFHIISSSLYICLTFFHSFKSLAFTEGKTEFRHIVTAKTGIMHLHAYFNHWNTPGFCEGHLRATIAALNQDIWEPNTVMTSTQRKQTHHSFMKACLNQHNVNKSLMLISCSFYTLFLNTVWNSIATGMM